MNTQFWLLTVLSSEQVDYDEYDSFVVEAHDEAEARFCAKEAGGDTSERWLDPSRTSCVPLELDGTTGVVVGSFNAG